MQFQDTVSYIVQYELFFIILSLSVESREMKGSVYFTRSRLLNLEKLLRLWLANTLDKVFNLELNNFLWPRHSLLMTGLAY